MVTPFRAQADALEAALLAEFSVDEIEKLGLRAGTVHGFQGSEAGLVIASLGLVDDDSPARHRFAADPNLFNVMVTRARRHMTVVTSLRPRRRASSATTCGTPNSRRPRPATEVDVADGWTALLAGELRRAGLPVRAGYPVGRWRVDLCVGEDADAVGLICEVHPDGVREHVERQRALLRAGWRLHDAFASRWSGDAVRAALELAHRIG